MHWVIPECKIPSKYLLPCITLSAAGSLHWHCNCGREGFLHYSLAGKLSGTHPQFSLPVFPQFFTVAANLLVFTIFRIKEASVFLLLHVLWIDCPNSLLDCVEEETMKQKEPQKGPWKQKKASNRSLRILKCSQSTSRFCQESADHGQNCTHFREYVSLYFLL